MGLSSAPQHRAQPLALATACGSHPQSVFRLKSTKLESSGAVLALLALTKQVCSGSEDAHVAGSGPGLWLVAPGPAASSSAWKCCLWPLGHREGPSWLQSWLVLMILESQGKPWLPQGFPEPPVSAHLSAQWDVTIVDEKRCHGP